MAELSSLSDDIMADFEEIVDEATSDIVSPLFGQRQSMDEQKGQYLRMKAEPALLFSWLDERVAEGNLDAALRDLRRIGRAVWKETA